MMRLSKIGQRMAAKSGIGQLMDDLGATLSKPGERFMLGGGNPAHIPEVEQRFRDSAMALFADQARSGRALGEYDPPEGHSEFIAALAALLREQCGWKIGPGNIALTSGSQLAFFILFNLFAGEHDDGTTKKILFPLTPEYIGYCDLALTPDVFTSIRPHIQLVGEHFFKYHVDFDRLEVGDDIGAICVSRPTNPSGNVLTNDELTRLGALAREKGIPLIVDNAYGLPFPHIVFRKAEPLWDDHTILCMSLSKLGLPAARTGILIASEELVETIGRVNSVMSLAPGGVGPALVTELVRSGEILRLSREVIAPFYERKAREAIRRIGLGLEGIEYRLHRPEGAFFLWLWLPRLPISCRELYERLKARNVIVVPGHYFFPGLAEPWDHANECLRISYAPDDTTVARGLDLIAQEIQRACKTSP
jgi:valine--pyruvate aminotransferase